MRISITERAATQPVRRRLPAGSPASALALFTSGRTGEDQSGTQREQIGIPEFSHSARVEARDGLIDKLELASDHGFVEWEEDEEVNQFRACLGNSPMPTRGRAETWIHGRLFNVSPNMNHALTVRRKRTSWGTDEVPPPPFSGNLETRKYPPMHGRIRCGLKSKLWLNLAEILNSRLPLFTRCEPPTAEEILYSSRLASDLCRGLDGKTNLMPPELSLRAAVEAQRLALRRIFEGIDSELLRGAEMVTGDPPPSSVSTRYLSPRKIEIHWEFRRERASEYIAAIEPTLRAFHREARERSHGFDQGICGNARTVTIFLGEGEEIRVYAKEADRLRFEAIFSPKKQNGLIEGGYTANSVSEFTEKLDAFRVRAAKRINELLSFLSEWSGETPQQRASSSRFARRWFQSLGFQKPVEQMLELLRINGRITRGRTLNQDGHNVLRSAERKGLIRVFSGVCYPAAVGELATCTGDTLTNEAAVGIESEHTTETQTAPSCFSNPLSISLEQGRPGVPPPPP